MAAPIDTIVKQLEDTGIVAAGKLKECLPPRADPKNVEELVAELVKQNQLTRFQAQVVTAGKTKSLILGSYTILDKIGAGGMGQVFRAEHRRMKRVVAIKMLPRAVTKDAAAAARFQREVEAAAKLLHSNIVSAFDADQANGVHFLVMEYVEGSDLSAHVKKDGRFPVDKAVNYILQAARGLEFAHAEGVVHRDIKPANLLLDKKGVVKILDMGLARIDVGGDVVAAAELTGTGTIMGTVDYMAPEQGLSTKHADARADIYSLGCSLHYLLIGKPTYGGDTVAAKLVAHHNHPTPNLCELRETVPEHVQVVFSKMVAKKIENRYQSMSEVVAELERCQAALTAAASSSTSVLKAPATDNKLSDMSLLMQHQKLARIDPSDPFAVEEPHPKPGWKGPPWKNPRLLIGAGAAGFLFLLLGVWVIVYDKEGNEVARVKVPEDGTATVQMSAPPKTTPAPTTAPAPKATLAPKKTVLAPPTFSLPAPTTTAKSTPAPGPAAAAIDYALERKVAQWLLDHKLVCKLQVNGNSVSTKPGEPLPTEPFTIDGLLNSPSTFIPRDELRGGINDFKRLAAFRGDCWVPKQDADLWAEAFASMPSIIVVNADKSDISDTGLAHLARLPQLNRLYLEGCSRLTAAGLLALSKSPSLTTLAIDQASFEADKYPLADLQRLQDAISRCHIVLSGGGGGSEISGLIRPGAKNAPGLALAMGTALTPPLAKVPVAPPLAEVSVAPPLAKAPFDATQAEAYQAAWAKYLDTTVETTNSVGQTMVLIPPGEFLMGSTDEQVAAALREAESVGTDPRLTLLIPKVERPQHRVIITKTFLMSATEVTIGQFKQFAAATSYQTEAEKGEIAAKAVPPQTPVPGQPAPKPPPPIQTYLNPGFAVTDESPAAFIAWNDAVAYCNWLSKQEEATYRLPTEAEWEYACRAGTTTLFSFGDDYAELAKYAWYRLTSSGPTIAVASKLPNPFGLYDMHGNAWELCQDLWDEKWYAKSPLSDPLGPDSGTAHVIRGGVDYYKKVHCRSANRMAATSNRTGFRCVRTLAFQQWMNDVAALPVERRVEAVAKKLQELNPGFDGEVVPTIENGIVTGLGIVTDNVADISPLRVLPGLNQLNCFDSSGKGKLTDLSPLKEMRLTSLNCRDNMALSDLSPLAGMPLTSLECRGTQVSDLSPLKGMPLESLACGATPVSDLSPLQDCQSLASLGVRQTKVTPAGVAALQKALPNCKIEWDEPPKPKTPEPAASNTK